jgi:hypothetical protein
VSPTVFIIKRRQHPPIAADVYRWPDDPAFGLIVVCERRVYRLDGSEASSPMPRSNWSITEARTSSACS